MAILLMTMETVGLCDHSGRDRPGLAFSVWPIWSAVPRRESDE